jgi:uncharacterized protein (DUF433 family)
MVSESVESINLIISYIVRDETHRRGKPRIKNTGITVQNIVEDMTAGMTREAIAEQFALTLSQVDAALSYYNAYRTEIDQAFEADRSALVQLHASSHYAESKKRTQDIRARLEHLQNQ